MATTERFEKVPIDKLVPYIRNARTHSKEQISQLCASLREFGFVTPVIIGEEYSVLAGRGRVIAAKEENITEIPCVFAEDLTGAQKKAYILSDNCLAMDAGWDEEMLAVEIADLQGADRDVSLLGVTDAEMNKLLDGDSDAKGKDISHFPDSCIQEKFDERNKRPRKCPGCRTPFEVYHSKSLHLA